MVSKTIHVDEEVHALIKQHAQPSGDSANRVLRRLLGLRTQPRGHSPAVTAVEAALRTARDVTVTEVANTAGVGRSTAASALATLEREGRARRSPGEWLGHQGRASDRWQPILPPDSR